MKKESESKLLNLEDKLRTSERKNKDLLRRIEREESLREQALSLKSSINTFTIRPKGKGGGSEAIAVALASDWHVEECVASEKVNGLNKYNLTISGKCAEVYFQAIERLISIFHKDIEINTLVLALLGDFFTNDIHEELAEINTLEPMKACLMVQDLIASGIQHLLRRTNVRIVIPCHSGNHARTTKSVHISTESGHSLEYFMYHNLARYFHNERRVQFVISEGYHSYLDCFGLTIRFHHGHMLRYQGGVGGIYIPVNKAIAQWNKAKHADLDCFGHWHTYKDGGNFISNGSMIGWNAFALSIKADFEKPRQAFFLIDRKRGRTVTAPICFPERR